MPVTFSRADAAAGDRDSSRRSVQTMAAKISSASTRWVARRYCETSTRCESPEATIHQPTAPCSAPRPKISHSRRFRSAPRTPRHRKPEKRQQIGNPDHAPEQPVAPFPPENRLELGQIHAGVEFAILRDGLVGVERLRPLLLIERRQRAGDRFPLDDREPGFGQTRGAADQHHDRDQGGDREQPPSDGAVWRLLCGNSGHRSCA